MIVVETDPFQDEPVFDLLESVAKEKAIDELLVQVEDTESLIENLTELLEKARIKLDDLNFQLINQTPTIRISSADLIIDPSEDGDHF